MPYPLPVIPFLLSAGPAAWAPRQCFLWLETCSESFLSKLLLGVGLANRPSVLNAPRDSRKDHRNNAGKVLLDETWNKVLVDFTQGLEQRGELKREFWHLNPLSLHLTLVCCLTDSLGCMMTAPALCVGLDLDRSRGKMTSLSKFLITYCHVCHTVFPITV